MKDTAQLVLEEQADDAAGDERSKEPHFLEHVAEACSPFSAASDFGKFWPRKAKP